MFVKRKKTFLVLACGMVSHLLVAMNASRPYEKLLKVPWLDQRKFQIYAVAETGFRVRGFDQDGNSTNVLRIWNCDQDALKMLEGFPAGSAIDNLRVRIGSDDDGIRGHFDVDGCLKYKYGVSLAARYALPLDFSIGAYMPFYHMRLSDVVWQDKTQNTTAGDFRVKQYLTSDFAQNVYQLGNLDIGEWDRSGPGDLALIIDWLRDFPQPKPLLKNVRLNLRLGLTIPTGVRQDEDKLFALPFGNDGTTGLLFGGGMTVTLGSHVKTGFDVELLHLFGTTKDRRIKTNADQTELLLLQKACAYKEWGFTQQFTLFIQTFDIIKGFSTEIEYQFYKRGDSSLTLLGNDFALQVANGAKSLEEYTMHDAIFGLRYSFDQYLDEDARAVPSILLFCKVPFNGKNTALATTLGAEFAVQF